MTNRSKKYFKIQKVYKKVIKADALYKIHKEIVWKELLITGRWAGCFLPTQ